MKIGAVIIHSSKYVQRRKYVDGLLDFFDGTGVEVNILEGVFTNDIYHDARSGMHDKVVMRGSVGTALAHMNAMKLALDKGYDAVFIFEDDVQINVANYDTLQRWINSRRISYDIIFLTNVGIFEGLGHDGRMHYKYQYDDIYKCSCLSGLQAYYLPKNTIRVMYETQAREVARGRIYISDSLQIHCEKSPDLFLKIITPVDAERFFRDDGFRDSIANSVS